MVRIRPNAAVGRPSSGSVATGRASQSGGSGGCSGGSRHLVVGTERHNNKSEVSEADIDPGPSAVTFLIGLVAFLAGSAVGIVECAAAALGFAAGIGRGCPTDLPRNLMGAGVCTLIGCFPLAAARVRDALCLRAALAKRRALNTRRYSRIKVESAIPRVRQQTQATAPDVAAAVPASLINWDILMWAVMQLDESNLKLLNCDSGRSPNREATSILRRFLVGIWRFYVPDHAADSDINYWERRRLVVALLFLPMSATYSMLLANQLLEALQVSSSECRPSSFLATASQVAVWLRVSLAGLALLACLFGSLVELMQRRFKRNRLADRLSQQKQSLFNRMFG